MPDERVGIIIEGQDKVSSVLRQIGQTGNSTFSNLKISGNKFGEVLKRMPEQFGKSATALLLFQSATSQMGGKVADAANKLTAVASLVATGGPLGIGIAAVTIAIAAASAAWETYTLSTRNAEAAQKSISAALDKQSERAGKLKAETRDLEEQVRFFGQTSSDVAQTKLKELINASEKATQTLIDERTALLWTEAATKEESDEIEKQVGNYDRMIKKIEEINNTRRRQVELLAQLDEKHKAETSAEERRQAIAARAQERRNTALASLRAEITAWDQAYQKGIEYNDISGKTIGTVSRLISKLENKTRITERESQLIREQIELSKFQRDDEISDLDRRNAVAEAFFQKQQNRIAFEASLREAMIKRDLENRQAAHAEINAQIQQQQQLYQQLATSMIGSVGQAVSGIVTDYKNAHKAILNAVISMVEKTIQAYAAQAAAGAAASQSAIPIVGPALAAAAASALFGVVRAYMSKFETGGIVRGQIGRDQIPIMASRGERVLSTRQTESFERLVDWMTASDRRNGGQSPVAGGGQIVFAPRIEQLDRGTAEERKQLLVKLGRELEELVDDGVILRNMVRA